MTENVPGNQDRLALHSCHCIWYMRFAAEAAVAKCAT